jgi:hypothetical protein
MYQFLIILYQLLKEGKISPAEYDALSESILDDVEQGK